MNCIFFFLYFQNTPKNNNRLASLIRETSEKRFIPRLSGTDPLEILLEIGLQKVSKDYEHILTESRICTSDGFQTFMRYVAMCPTKITNFH